MKKTIFEMFDDLHQKINSSLEYHELHNKFNNTPQHDTTISKLTFEILPHNLTNLAKVIIDLFFRNNAKYQYISHLFIDEFAKPDATSLQLKCGNYILAQKEFKESFETKNEHKMILACINQIQHGYEFYDELLKLILENTYKIVDPNFRINLNKIQYSDKINRFSKHIKHQYFLDKKQYEELIKIYDSDKRNSFTHKNYIPDVNNKVVKYFDRNMNEFSVSYEDLLNESLNIYENIISYILTITSLGVLTHTTEPNILPKEYLKFCVECFSSNN